MNRKKALISYSHKDESYRAALVSALANLVRGGELEIWSDHQVLPGQHIDGQIMAQLREADVVFLLVSPDFIASDYCYQTELQIALERHDNGRAVVVPIVIRPTDWHGSPFSRILMLPVDARPVSSWSNIDEAWLSVAHGVRRVLGQMSPQETEPKILRTKGVEQHLKDAFDQLQDRFNDSSAYRAARFGFSLEPFDEIVGGVWPGEWLVIASRPEHGHMELAQAMALDAAAKGKMKVLVASQRLTSSQFTNRLLCQLGRVSRLRLFRGALEDEDWSRVSASIRLLKSADLTIDDDAIRSHSDLKKKLSEIEKENFNLVLLDGLEYLSGGSEERAISITLSDFSKRTGVALVTTLSLGAEMESRAYRKPMLADFNEWRILENFAGKIVLSFRESAGWGDAPDELSGDCELALIKSSDGVPASFKARYFHEYGIINGPINYA